MPKKQGYDRSDCDAGEQENTMDSDLPVPVEPPVLPVETDATAVPVSDEDGLRDGSTPSVTVIAPQTLPGGYVFPARVDGIDFTVVVPSRGVLEGEQFLVPYPSQDASVAAAETTASALVQGDDPLGTSRSHAPRSVSAYAVAVPADVMDDNAAVPADCRAQDGTHERTNHQRDGCTGTQHTDARPGAERVRVHANTNINTDTGATAAADEGTENDGTHRGPMNSTVASNRSATRIQPLEMETSKPPSAAPIGRWRHKLCACTQICFAPLFCFSICCSLVVFGQLAQRLKLNVIGFPTNSYQYTCRIITVLCCTFFVLGIVVASRYYTFFSYLYVWIFSMSVRYHYRKKYKIPPSTCGACDGRLDDFCCASFCCSCCVSIQIARHTHDERVHPYRCCSETGLSSTAPEIV